MLCQHCKRNLATINSYEDINGVKSESHFCAECYAELFGGLNSKANNDLWAGLFGEPVRGIKVCPVCGTTYADYERTGLLGCAGCYDVFKEELIPSIRRIQGKTDHVGKRENNSDQYGLYRQLSALQEELEAALRDRQYERAGRLNKQIDGIKKKLKGGSDE